MVKTNSSATAVEKKAKAAPRTLEQRIAELQAQADARKAKKAASARKAYDILVERFTKQEAKLVDLATEITTISDEHGFELPASLADAVGEGDEPETTDEAEAKFELEQETVGA